jgi:hypothetical protein
VLLNFLSHMLREEGGPEFKRSIVEALVTLIQQIDEAKEPGLLHLAEFIEDCEFTTLAVQVRCDSYACEQCRCMPLHFCLVFKLADSHNC